jgi:hypothetical protein
MAAVCAIRLRRSYPIVWQCWQEGDFVFSSEGERTIGHLILERVRWERQPCQRASESHLETLLLLRHSNCFPAVGSRLYNTILTSQHLCRPS